MYKNLNQCINLNDHVYSTRNRDKIVTMFQRLALTQHSVSYSGPHIWNSLQQNLTNIQSFSTFKRELKSYIMKLYTHSTCIVFLHAGKHFLHLWYYIYIDSSQCTLPELDSLVNLTLLESGFPIWPTLGDFWAESDIAAIIRRQFAIFGAIRNFWSNSAINWVANSSSNWKILRAFSLNLKAS